MKSTDIDRYRAALDAHDYKTARDIAVDITAQDLLDDMTDSWSLDPHDADARTRRGDTVKVTLTGIGRNLSEAHVRNAAKLLILSPCRATVALTGTFELRRAGDRFEVWQDDEGLCGISEADDEPHDVFVTCGNCGHRWSEPSTRAAAEKTMARVKDETCPVCYGNPQIQYIGL